MFFRNEYAFLSNMYPCEIKYKGMTFSCTEAAYQSQKSTDPAEQAKFQELTGPQSKRMGRQLEIDPTFDERKVGIMKELIDIKFADPVLAKALINVKEPIVEDNTWGDTFWGKCAGVGENHLGQILANKRMELLWEENSNEQMLLHGNFEKSESMHLGIYQMDFLSSDKCFRPIKDLSEISDAEYKLVYTTPLNPAYQEVTKELLSDIFTYYNTEGVRSYKDTSKGFHGRSLSVSDIIVIRKGNTVTGHYVQDFGFYDFTIIEPVCEYSFWKIVNIIDKEGEYKQFIVDIDDDGKQQGPTEVELIAEIPFAKYENISMKDAIKLCKDPFEYAGETKTGYCFWKAKKK